MDELKTALKKFVGEQATNRKSILLLLVLLVAIVFVVNSVSSGSAKTVISSRAQTGNHEPNVSLPKFYIHIVGEIKTPGVYELEVGARLFDAVVAAGGFLSDADQGSVNLARTLTDGEQIIVLKEGMQQTSTGAGGIGALISINRGTQAELESLPGVGPALAGRIIDWRAANGGFKKKEDLLNVGGIGDKLFAGLSKSITL